MLPPGHVAAGFLLARLVALSSANLANSTFFGFTAFFAFIPDLDFFVSFSRTRSLTITEAANHRLYFTHAPLLYLAIFIIWIILFPGSSLVAFAFILGTWSHFLLDTLSEAGIMWLYPFTKKSISFKTDKDFIPEGKQFLSYWIDFLQKYAKLFSFKLEIFLIVLAAILLLTIN